MSQDVTQPADRAWLELSLAQQSVWLDAKVSGTSVYQLGGWARIAAPIDEAAVRQSVRLLMARHDALRLRVDDELPRQWLDASPEPPITIIDLLGHTSACACKASQAAGVGVDRDARERAVDRAFQAYVAQVFAEPMPLGDHPLFRIELASAGADLHYVLWRFHHLIADSLSVALTLSHWFEAYDALTSTHPRELAPTSSYLKTITADAAYLESAAYHQNLAYWVTRFEPLPPPLIRDLEQKAHAQPSPSSAASMLTGEAFLALQAAAQAAGVSAQRALFALFALALGRRYGQTDIVSGVALHRRELANRATLGMMAGVIAVRCDFDPFWTLEECVQAFSEQVDADLRHQRLPVDVLSRALGLSGTGRTGLFEVAMSYIPADRGAAGSPLGGLPITTGMVESREASPISLHVTELAPSAGSTSRLADAGGVSIRVAVNPDFFDPGEATALGALLASAIHRFTSAPDTRFEDLELLTAHERVLVLEDWNRTTAAFPSGTLDGLFAAQAVHTPDALAVIGLDGRTLTYAELDAQSTHLARQLVAGGVEPGRVVGVRMARSAETILALLAILKAGGAYLPLDPAYPAERLEYMASDADAMLVLDSTDLLDRRDGLSNGMEAELPALPSLADPERLAYVIYTSGTTGLPKGVAVSHAAAVNLAFARRDCHDPLGPGDRVLAAISVGFDVSIGQLLLPLLSGATVVIAGEIKTMDAADFWALLHLRGVTHINSVPSFFDSLLSAGLPVAPLALKRLMLGGEALTGALVERIHKAFPGLEVVNMYGPTETCIDATFHIATSADYGATTLPIGRPLSNYRAFVLDSALAPVGVGVTGELYLGGAGLARGYVNAPQLTAERFIADPFSSRQGERLYRSGDRARWRADGVLEFLGRGDEQVKIRGFRVEPGEVAACLLSHPDVAQAVVVARPADPSRPGAQLRLIAYVVPRSGSAVPDAASLRAFAAERLPDYMAPSVFVSLVAMPLNRNGKLDTGALPSPELDGGDYLAPRTPTETTIAALFAEVLGLDRCGVHDHFFELGGHSLLATSLVAKLRAHGWTVPLRAIFETPTVELLSRRIDAELPALPSTALRPQPMTPYQRPAELPLSYSQERIWFVDRLQQDSSYNIPVAFRLRGRLDTRAAVQAIEQILTRHEALRTRIVLHGSHPVQEVVDSPALPLRELDLAGLAPPSREAALEAQLAALATYRFDLASQLPIRLLLITLAHDHHVLAAVIHHVAFDGWSAGVFLQEFAGMYTALADGQPAALAPLAVQYADFTLWQREQDRTADLRYWLDELKDAPAQLDLPSLVPDAGQPTRLSSNLPLQLEPDLHAGLLRLARERGASLFMLLHAAFALLLARLSGQDDVVLGTVTANRSRGEFEPLIGCFVNAVPLRTRFEAGESFSSLLARVKSADLAAFTHQDLPFEQLVDALHLERSLEHTPLFQVMFVFQNAPMTAPQLPALVLEPIPIEADTAKFDLTLTLSEDGGSLAGAFEYASNRFSSDAIERLADQFQRLLRAVAADPEHEALTIEVLDPSERALVLAGSNQTEHSFEAGMLDGLFHAQALRTPHATAVVGLDGQALSYAELDRRSTLLARRLAGRGVQPEQVVGVRMERSTETVIALLAILKAGGVYLPLDPAYPADRLAYMIADAGAALVLDSLDVSPDDAAAGLPELTQTLDPDPERLAYVIYTSGTTGLPKGVAVPHRAAVNLAFARRAAHDPLGAGDRVLAAISVGFDVSIGQLLLPLLAGATVVIAGDLKQMSAADFWALVADTQVTHINSVPSFLESVLQAAPPAYTLALKRLMLGGEALSGALVARIKRAIPHLEVVNMYGPTEACIDATYHVAQEADFTSAVLPIGRPLPNYRAYLLDARMQPVGIGVAGELYLGGVGLARGYVHAPELTADRFVADPFSTQPGARLYRTGDRASRRADGAIEFLGRIDNQVKIRGFRVEPGEIEAQLRRQPGVRESAVIAQPGDGGTRLIAYYTSSTPVAPEVLRTALAAALPDYMVPAAYVRLDQLPLSLNGKLDRKALPAPGQEAFAARVYEAPVGETEQAMARLWAELLNLAKVGRNDNFFELGGHSLLAVTLIERMRRQQLPGDVRALFLTPTIRGLAAASSSSFVHAPAPANLIPAGAQAITPTMLPLVALTEEQLKRIVHAVPGGAPNVQDIYPLAPLQEGILFQHRMSTGGDPYLTPFLLAFASRTLVDSFVEALGKLVKRHDVLRTAMAWQDLDAPVQIVLREVELPVDELTLNGADAAGQLLARFDPLTFRLDLTQAPLLRVVLAEDQANSRWLLLLLTHHLILDHTSLEILLHELRTLMAAPRAELPAPLPYRDFIAQSRDHKDEEHQAFFARLLGDVDEPTAPYGLLDTQANAGPTAESHLTLQPAQAQAIRKQARALGVTPASLFHLAWAAVLGHISGKADVVFGTVLFGRMRSAAGADRVVGMFINTLPMRLRLDATGAAESVLQTHRLLAELLTHEHAPLALAQRASAVPPPVPLFSSLFNYRYSAEREGERDWPGVTLVHAAERTNYPLAMAVDDSGASFALTALAQPGVDTDRVCRYLEHALAQLVTLLGQYPETPIEQVQVLPPAERALVLEHWSHADQSDPGALPAPTGMGSTLHELFSMQTQARPDAIAVIGQDGTCLSYASLDERSTRLARQLVARGVKPRAVIGVRMERSTETVIALLAILKAGAIYLPLDPAYPAERLEYMAADAGAQLVLDQSDLPGDELGEANPLPLPVHDDPEELAYIIYTSGTTGLPKGVAVAHRAAVNLAFGRRAAHDPLGPGDRVLAAISVGFDVSIGQLLLPLLAGATVVVAGDLKTMGPADFWSLLVERRVTHINSVPSFLDSILAAAPAPGTLALKRLMLGGEALSGSLVARLAGALPAVEVVNMYGPTEACIDATYHVAGHADYAAAVLPIGRPLPNYLAHILDSRMQPVGVGVLGELYLGGAGLAQGYVNAPELTAARFVANPFSASLGARLYRSGDLARWRADGAIEFLGRVDAQVKIRGFRVEPGEVEAQLRRQPGIREAAVVAAAADGGTRLIAYYTGEHAGPIATLRAALAATLPDYMVPSAFVRLDQLLLSPNGKLDRKALPTPEQEAFATRSYQPPLGEAEQTMASLWAELLKLDRVGRHDNFFELGGHSLLAVTLIERMRQQGLPCDVRALFTTPTIAGLAANAGLLAPEAAVPANLIPTDAVRITPEMLPLLTLSQAQIDRIVSAAPGGAANIQDIYPLAPLQEGILFQHLVAAEGDPYLTPLVLGFDDRPLLNRFLDALDHLVQRHDVLRTAMVWSDLDEPAQVVHRHVALPVVEVTLDETRPEAATQLLSRFDPRTFRIDVSQAPLLRAIVALDHRNGRWLLLLLTHHLILDHTSLEILVKELHALVANPQVELEPALPYRNFIAQTRSAPIGEGHAAFFTRMLADVDEPTAPYGLLDVQAGAGNTVEGRLNLPSSLAVEVRRQARFLGVTPASLFHLAWAAVLGHLSGKSDVVFGTVLFGRMRSAAGADRVVGMFINTLPLRLRLDQGGAAASVLEAHRLLAELLAHEHAPLALAQRASAVPAPEPLFSSLFNYRYSATDDTAQAWSGIDVVRAAESTNYPLAMAIDDFGSDFTLIALAQAGIDPSRVCRYLQQALSGLLTLLKDAPNTPIHGLQVLPEDERAQVVDHWNRTALPFEAGTLDALFCVQAARTPDAVAVLGVAGETLTYRELDTQSTLLARRIVSRGVRPGQIVGVRMERSAATIIVLLAILKAGAVYLPLDPAYPPDRLAYMLADAQAALVIDSPADLAGAPEGVLPTGLDSERLAYVIYTSGTTGLPKGVAVSHAAAVNLAHARRAAHDPLGPGDRVLAAISVGFDVSIGQLLLPLLAGATVVIAGELRAMNGVEFWALLAGRQVTHINSVPSFLDSILDLAPPPGTLALKRLMLGGEALTGALLARLHQAFPGIEVVNMYGPTEACIDATYHVATDADHLLPTLPIGRPLPNYQAFVLDARMQPVGIGVAGELYLGGAGLAQGYVNASALTAERFVSNPFATTPGARLYRTGDRARFRADGAIEFLGRVDNQVKIRGFRVEPGEIEAQLRRQPGVREAAVIPYGDPGSLRLIAYYTAADRQDAAPDTSAVASADTSAEQLRAALACTLPDYMVPASFIRLSRLPLSLNGKLDRRALPDPGQAAARLYTAPLGPDEEKMASLWAQVLKLDRVGRDENFFELGGDSLSAMRLVHVLGAAFQVPVPIRLLFQHPTVTGLTHQLCSGRLGSAAVRNLVPLRSGGAGPKLFVVHGLSGHVFHYLPLVRQLGPDQPVYGLQADGLEDGEQPASSVEAMARSYVDAMMTVQPTGPYHLLGYSSGGLLAFEMAQQFRLRHHEVALLALLDTSLPDPLMERTVSDQDLVLDMAASLGVADLIAGSQPVPGLAEMVEQARQAGRLPAELELIHVERMANVFRNTVRTCPDYHVLPWDGPLLLVRAMQRPPEAGPPPDWSPYVTGDLHVVDLDCSHTTLIAPEMVSAVAAVVTRELDAALVSARPLKQNHDDVPSAVGQGAADS